MVQSHDEFGNQDVLRLKDLRFSIEVAPVSTRKRKSELPIWTWAMGRRSHRCKGISSAHAAVAVANSKRNGREAHVKNLDFIDPLGASQNSMAHKRTFVLLSR